MQPRHRVFVLDPEQRASLAVVRSLGRRDIQVFTGGHVGRPIAAASRFCSAHHLLPDPSQCPELFLAALDDRLRQTEADVLLPITDLTTSLVLAGKAQLGDVATALPEAETYHRVSDKYALLQLAEKQGVPIPRTLFLDRLEQLEALDLPFAYPVVIKPARSRLEHDGRWIATSVSYARSAADLTRRVRSHAWFPKAPILLQEYVAGEGRGLFCLFERGQPILYFAHRRLREKPPSGGVSVLCESVPVPARMREAAEALLRPLHWHGVAMVEFKVAADGTPYLMEINARPWGSIQLAIDAGVDFPYLLYRLALQLDLPREIGYRSGVRSRWLLGDLDRLYLVLKDRSGRYSPLDKGSQIIDFLKFWERSGYDTFQLRDPRPFWAELAAYLRQLGG